MDEATTIIHMLEANAAKHPSRVAYADKLTGAWRTATWQEYNQRTRQIANNEQAWYITLVMLLKIWPLILAAAGIQHGDDGIS